MRVNLGKSCARVADLYTSTQAYPPNKGDKAWTSVQHPVKVILTNSLKQTAADEELLIDYNASNELGNEKESYYKGLIHP